MIMGMFFSSIGGRIATTAVGTAGITAGLGYYMAGPELRARVIGGIFSVIAWTLLVAILPWALFLVIGWIEKFKNNSVSFAFIAGVTVIEAIGWFWLWDFGVSGAAAWTFTIAAILFAGVYNVFSSDWIAEQVA